VPSGARRGEEEPVAPTKARSADVPTEHLKLVAEDHDFQVLGVLVAPREPSEDSPEDQAMSDRTMAVLPLPRCCPTLPGLRLGTLIPNKCTLQALKVPVPFSLGFAKPGPTNSFGSPGSFGHPGSGGSFGFADSERQIGYGYVINGMGPT
jgi:hypothetical protein